MATGKVNEHFTIKSLVVRWRAGGAVAVVVKWM